MTGRGRAPEEGGQALKIAFECLFLEARLSTTPPYPCHPGHRGKGKLGKQRGSWMFACESTEVGCIGSSLAVVHDVKAVGSRGSKLQPCVTPFPTERGRRPTEILATKNMASW